jgi:hypothetical protein
MEIIATNEGGGNFKKVDAGNYAARCYSMIHIGSLEEEFQGVKKLCNKVRITWELPTELAVFKEENGEQPFSVSKEFTLSMHEKATLRKFLESWRGKGFTEEEAKRFDVSKLIGAPCMLNIIHKESKTGKTYADISSVSTMPKGLQCPEQINKTIMFSIAQPDWEVFNSLPSFLQDKIKLSKEYAIYQRPAETETPHSDLEQSEDFGDPLPF